jgi:hypothetical protein
VSVLQHVVLFSFPEDLSAEDWAEMQRQVRSWPGEIDGLDALRLGPALDDARTRGYQYLLYMEVADVETLVAYQQHPTHQVFLQWVRDRDCTPLAFDYYLDESTVVVASSETSV